MEHIEDSHVTRASRAHPLSNPERDLWNVTATDHLDHPCVSHMAVLSPSHMNVTAHLDVATPTSPAIQDGQEVEIIPVAGNDPLMIVSILYVPGLFTTVLNMSTFQDFDSLC